jgi:hypothetical protein
MGVSEVRCPACGYEYVHPVAVKVEPVSGDTLVYINSTGVFAAASSAAERVRGIQITTTFLCENGHQWDETRGFHKGFTTQTVERGPDWSDAELTPTTLWRD